MTRSNQTPLPPVLERAHSWSRAQPWLGRFTLMNRLLLAMAFIPTGLVKATGQRFTTLPVENPVGFFFEAMYQTGPYWFFIGAMQILAGVLLLVPATA
ncbi:MAG: DoxX family protein, partial [Longimicrobiales bacterium]